MGGGDWLEGVGDWLSSGSLLAGDTWDTFEDWWDFVDAGAPWQNDVGAAKDEARRLVEQTASERAWPTTWRDTGVALVDGTNADTPDNYFAALALAWGAYDSTAAASGVAGWSDLTNAWKSAYGAAVSAEEANEAGTMGQAAVDAAAETAGDIAGALPDPTGETGLLAWWNKRTPTQKAAIAGGGVLAGLFVVTR